MHYSAYYARALFDLVTRGGGASEQQGSMYLENLKQVLARRGHQSLLPNIFAEYQKLVQRRERAANQAKITPERERTRVLLELYRRLVATH